MVALVDMVEERTVCVDGNESEARRGGNLAVEDELSRLGRSFCFYYSLFLVSER